MEVVIHGIPGSGKTSSVLSLIGRTNFIFVPELWRLFPQEDLRGDFWSVILKDILREIYIEQIRKNNLVIAERNHISTFAYRYAQGIDLKEEFKKLSKHFSIPDLYILFKIDTTKALERVKRRDYHVFKNDEHTANFFDQFYRACIRFIKLEGVKYRVIDADKPLDEITEKILEVIRNVGSI